MTKSTDKNQEIIRKYEEEWKKYNEELKNHRKPSPGEEIVIAALASTPTKEAKLKLEITNNGDSLITPFANEGSIKAFDYDKRTKEDVRE